MRRGDFLVCALQDSGRVCFSTACLATQRRFYGLLLASLGGGRRLDRQSPTQLPTLVNQTAKNFQLSEVSADKGYSSFDNHEAITKAGAVPYIAFKANATGEVGGMFQKMYHFYCFKRDEFLRSYHKRSTEFRRPK